MSVAPKPLPALVSTASGDCSAENGSPQQRPGRWRWRWRDPIGNPPGSRGLALFYIELRDDEGRLQGIRVNRLKDKLGTRKVSTAELSLEGTPARLVGAPNGGVRAIVPMLQVTRIWNSVSAASFMRRGIALARDYARRRVAFDAPLNRQPLHTETLATLQAEFEGAFHLSFLTAGLLGAEEPVSPMSVNDICCVF